MTPTGWSGSLDDATPGGSQPGRLAGARLLAARNDDHGAIPGPALQRLRALREFNIIRGGTA